MKWLRDASLKKLGALALGGLFVLFAIEVFIINNKVEYLEELEERKDFARSTQMQGQQIAYLVQLHLNGAQGLEPQIYARIKELNHAMKVLGTGGRIPNSSHVVGPLTTLPRITYDNLHENWRSYQSRITELLSTPVPVPGVIKATNDSLSTDSISTNALTGQVEQGNASSMQNLLSGEWLTLSHWYERLLTDLQEEVTIQKSAVENWFMFILIADALLTIGIFFALYQLLLKPLERVRANAFNHIQDTSFRKDEVGAVAHEINEILEQLKDAADFVAAIGEGKLDFDYRILDSQYAEGKNRLADSLISMQGKLKALSIEEQRRQWANEGLTKFVDILRSSNDNINTLGDKIISALVKYTNSNQGGLYILNDEDERNRYLELISLFAFDIKKFEKQKLKLGEGILGQTFLEKETTILNEVPEEYIRITSGLGGTKPKSLLIVPLKVDKDVYGIVELASFKDYQPHEIAFVEKLAETIASTLASVKAAHKNRYLIEQFQQQTEEMRSQEEEMRQNMEELQATQEELSRKEQDYISRIQELETAMSQSKVREDERVRQYMLTTQGEYQARINELEATLSQRVKRADDWQLAESVEKDLRIQLEALRIANEEAT